MPGNTKEKAKNSSDTDSDDTGSEQELTQYIDDRIKLMQVALKLIKPKQLNTMIPDCIKDLPISEVKKLLLDELLGISKKRLQCILAGENLDLDTNTSTESEAEKQVPVDVISLDDITDSTEIYISDDDNCMEIELSERERLEMEIERPKTDKNSKITTIDNHKKVSKTKIKKEKSDKIRKKYKKKASHIKKECAENETEDPVMNVLNLLELQARARAIRSQLANEVLIETKTEDVSNNENGRNVNVPEDSDNSVIFVSPKNTPVVTVHSDSEVEKKSVTNNEEKEKSPTSIAVEAASPKLDTIAATSTQLEFLIDEDNDILIVTEESILDKESECCSQKKQEENQADSADEINNLNDVTWKSRWLESPKIKNVMRTTKIYNNIRQSRKVKHGTQEVSLQSDIVSTQELETENEISLI